MPRWREPWRRARYVASTMADSTAGLVSFDLDGAPICVPDDGSTLLQVLREQLGVRSVKDGCSPQGQCGCCTVWVDGRPRVACVTALRRVAGRQVTTLDGLPTELQARWAAALLAHGASQCGFCTPGIIMRLAASDGSPGPEDVRRALAANLCRCTGWQSIVEAASTLYAEAAEPAGPHASPCGDPVQDRPLDDIQALEHPGDRVLVRDRSGDDTHSHDRSDDIQTRDRRAGSAGDLLPGAGCPPRRAGRPPTRAAPCRDLALASRRATIEGGAFQRVGMDVVLGRGGFADDTAPPDALVAVPDGQGEWVVAETLAEARRKAGAVPGRRTTRPLRHPVAVPAGSWALRWQTTFVEPAYLEPDASWCTPGGEPAAPLANGGAFGGKVHSPAPAAAQMLAKRTGRPVRVVLSREDVVRLGPKRPPLAAGIALEGTGTVHVARTPGSELDGWADGLRLAAPGLAVEVVEVSGPPVSSALRGAGWVEGAVLAAALGMLREAPHIAEPGGAHHPVAEVITPAGARATARFDANGTLEVAVRAGEVLDETVLRSYCIGAAHQGLGWVWREALTVDDDGVVHDLTIRSFGVLPARDMPPVSLSIEASDAPPVRASDAVLAAVAAVAWAETGFAPTWPTARGER